MEAKKKLIYIYIIKPAGLDPTPREVLQKFFRGLFPQHALFKTGEEVTETRFSLAVRNWREQITQQTPDFLASHKKTKVYIPKKRISNDNHHESFKTGQIPKIFP